MKLMNEALRVLIVEPHEAPREFTISNSLSDMQAAVKGLIQIVYNGDGTVIVCNDEGKLLGMEGNRRIEGDVIAGPFFVAGDDGEHLRSLTDEEMSRYMQRFGEIEDIPQEEVESAMGFTFICF